MWHYRILEALFSSIDELCVKAEKQNKIATHHWICLVKPCRDEVVSIAGILGQCKKCNNLIKNKASQLPRYIMTISRVLMTSALVGKMATLSLVNNVL